jgi:hypothetical protein
MEDSQPISQTSKQAFASEDKDVCLMAPLLVKLWQFWHLWQSWQFPG